MGAVWELLGLDILSVQKDILYVIGVYYSQV
mgnify:CR=1 FL=1